jgi:murein DD-endopeptidase MepM/ murein hydrolase activator NlpD/N-acetylneuraminic acid mutarotase
MNRLVKIIKLFIIILFIPLYLSSNLSQVLAADSSGEWINLPTLPASHLGASGIITLANGKVLVATGYAKSGLTSSSHLFDPVSRSWTTTGNVNQARGLHNNAIVKLNDGTILIAGGEGPNVSDLASVELYNLSTGKWTLTDPLSTPRRYLAIVLENGKVLATGGAKGTSRDTRYLESSEIYDPASGQWTYSGDLNIPREGAPEIVLLQNGKVLLAGGYYKDAYIDKAEVYDPTTGEWTISQMPYAWGGATLTVLENGKVLVAGGSIGLATKTAVVSSKAMLYNPVNNSWTQTASMRAPRGGHNSALLSDGKVLIIGGGTTTAEIYDPKTEQWTIAPQTRYPAHNGIALLQNKDVLAIGGDPDGLAAELFTSPASPTPTPPEPFLDLPWNYDCQQAIDSKLNEACEKKYGQAKHKNFNSAALAINSFFDHEYPFFSRPKSLPEPGVALGTIVPFFGLPRLAPPTYQYSSHDGYDYGHIANAKYPDPQLAAGDGTAIYFPEKDCPSCGNAIHIDHGNHFQTRYYHLDSKGLNPSVPYKPTQVKRGEKIGIIGYTGNVDPKGESGSHIHFMVIEDKDRDGDFENNIPDGLVDPFGWMPEEEGIKPLDSWETHTFFYNGKERTGNKSHYLWRNKLSNMKKEVLKEGAKISLENFSLDFPTFFIDKDGLNIKAFLSPYIQTEIKGKLLQSIGPSITVLANDFQGAQVTSFLKSFKLSIDFNSYSLFNTNPQTLSIFSSHDGIAWSKEETEVDLDNEIATAQINHLTQFALMGELEDAIAPTTTAFITGENGQANWYRSNVIVALTAIDNKDGLGTENTVYEVNDNGAQEYTEPLVFTHEGDYKLEYYSEDKAGNVENTKIIEFNIDKAAPVVSATPERSTDFIGWYNYPLTVTFTGEDKESGLDNCTLPINYSQPDNIRATVEGSCSDKAGNIATAQYQFQYDSTPPVISARATSKGQVYESDTWTNDDVQIVFICTDQTSGVNNVSQPATFTGEGKNQSIKGTCEDNAGNKSETTFTGIYIDKTKPVINIHASPNTIWPPNGKMVDVKITGNSIDTSPEKTTFQVIDEYGQIQPSLTGFNQAIKLEAKRNGNDKNGRTYAIKAYAKDKAGNTSEAETTVLVPHDKGN